MQYFYTIDFKYELDVCEGDNYSPYLTMFKNEPTEEEIKVAKEKLIARIAEATGGFFQVRPESIKVFVTKRELS